MFRDAVISGLITLASAAVTAEPVLLDTSTLSFSASGSPNTIAGTWGGQSLQVWSLDAIRHFTIELDDLTSSFGAPGVIGINNALSGIQAGGLALCADPVNCVGGIALDLPYEIHSSQGSPWRFMVSLVEGYYGGAGVTSGNGSAIYGGGGPRTTASARFTVSVFGDAPPVPSPEPGSLPLAAGAFAVLQLLRLARASA
jgi:hypothetical protein